MSIVQMRGDRRFQFAGGDAEGVALGILRVTNAGDVPGKAGTTGQRRVATIVEAFPRGIEFLGLPDLDIEGAIVVIELVDATEADSYRLREGVPDLGFNDLGFAVRDPVTQGRVRWQAVRLMRIVYFAPRLDGVTGESGDDGGENASSVRWFGRGRHNAPGSGRGR